MYSNSSLINFKYSSKKIIKWAIGKDHNIKLDIKIPKIRIGTNYGGWFIYDRPLLRKNDNIIVSFGIGNDVSFDLDMIKFYRSRIFAYDPTPMSLDWLKKQDLPSNFHASPIGVAAEDGEIEFGLPLQKDWDSYSILSTKLGSVRCPVQRVQTILGNIKIDNVDVMKMDIEGSEYEVIDDLMASKIYPGQLLIEFHYHHRGPKTAKDVIDKISKLRDAGYLVFDISPWGREFSLVRKDII